ncbi:hypothetical protein [Martelella soudanensis]|uniref:hypothetical protein n=1 Tax=unclassified Martelella TaxID=2629616 RepID=UPI0015DE7A92|nr:MULTISPECIES: hypothetical protein [unclassified Martelella]
MSMETGTTVPHKANTQRPLPPEIKFHIPTGTFSGTAEPGKVIKLTNTADKHTRLAPVDKDGHWEIVMGKEPRWYTIFQIWASDPATGATSHTTNYTFGGNKVMLKDVYASRSLVFGRARPGTEIIVFGPAGQTLGRTFVFGRESGWAVNFREALDAGEKVCVIASRPDGSTSMPVFVKAETFSVDDRNVGRIAGAGARTGDRFEIIDVASDQKIAEATVTDAGNWSANFADMLEAGTRIGIERFHQDGSSSTGPIVTVTTHNCPAPVIDLISASEVAGTARPGLLVRYNRYRDSQPVVAESIRVPPSGTWTVPETDLQEGDSIVATTADSSGMTTSQLYASVTVGSARPGIPLVASTAADCASGYANPGDYVVASTTADGVIAWSQVKDDATWAVQWTPLPDWSDETMLVHFTIYTALAGGGHDTPSSHSCIRYASESADPPPKPVITSWSQADATFHGTEGLVQTKIKIFNTETYSTVAKTPQEITSSNWSEIADYPPSPGDGVYAQAIGTTDSGDPGATSDQSDTFYC